MFLAGLAVAAIPFFLRPRDKRTKTPPPPETGGEQYGGAGTTSGYTPAQPAQPAYPTTTGGEQYGG